MDLKHAGAEEEEKLLQLVHKKADVLQAAMAVQLETPRETDQEVVLEITKVGSPKTPTQTQDEVLVREREQPASSETQSEKSQSTRSEEEGEGARDKLPEESVTFTAYCNNMRQKLGFVKLNKQDELKVGYSDNVDKIIKFLTSLALRYSGTLETSRIVYLNNFVGAASLQQSEHIKSFLKTCQRQTSLKLVKGGGLLAPRKPNLGVPKTGTKGKMFSLGENSVVAKPETNKAGKLWKKVGKKPLKHVPVVETDIPLSDQKEFEAFVQEKIEEHKAKKLPEHTDLRWTDEKNTTMRKVFDSVVDKFDDFTEWHIVKLYELCGYNLQGIRNFLLLRFRLKNKGKEPAFRRTKTGTPKQGKRKQYVRTPNDPSKGLGCGKCRYGSNGCGTCGYYDDHVLNQMGADKAAKIKEQQQKILQKAASKVKTAASKPKKLHIKFKATPRTKKVKRTNSKKVGSKVGSKRNGRKIMSEEKRKEEEEKRRLHDKECQERIDKVAAARCIPYRPTSQLKKEIYNRDYHVSNITVAKRHRRDFLTTDDTYAALRAKNQDSTVRRAKVARNGEYQTCRLNTLVKIGKSPVHAWGLFAAVPIKKGTRVIEYIGELTRSSLADMREQYYERNGMDSSYLFRVGSNLIDATVSGGPARYINHSCDPNCKPEQFVSDNKIFIYSLRDIQPGEELYYDYKFDFESDEKRVACMCGVKNCCGWMN